MEEGKRKVDRRKAGKKGGKDERSEGGGAWEGVREWGMEGGSKGNGGRGEVGKEQRKRGKQKGRVGRRDEVMARSREGWREGRKKERST